MSGIPTKKNNTKKSKLKEQNRENDEKITESRDNNEIVYAEDDHSTKAQIYRIKRDKPESIKTVKNKDSSENIKQPEKKIDPGFDTIVKTTEKEKHSALDIIATKTKKSKPSGKKKAKELKKLESKKEELKEYLKEFNDDIEALSDEDKDYFENDVPRHNYRGATIKRCLESNEDGDALIYKEVNNNKSIFDKTTKEWYAWYLTHWKIDDSNLCLDECMMRVKLIYMNEKMKHLELSCEPGADKSEIKKSEKIMKALAKRFSDLSTLKRKKNVLELSASGKTGLSITNDQWNKKHYLMAFKNVVIDLRTGEKVTPNPEDYINMSCEFEYDPDAKFDDVNKFLSEILEPELIGSVERLFGYSFLGSGKEHIIIIFYGPKSRSGKSKLMEMLKAIFNEFMTSTSSNFFDKQKNPSGKEAPSAQLLSTMGKRISWSSETGMNEQIDPVFSKQFSGQDTLKGRYPHSKKTVEFKNNCVHFILTNNLPVIPANDEGLLERLVVIEFKNKFVNNPDPKKPWEKQKNKDILEKLLENPSGIINLLIKCCKDYHENGLNLHQNIINRKEEYRESQDFISHFVQEECIVVPYDTSNRSTMFEKRTKLSVMYEHFIDWCKINGHEFTKQAEFVNGMNKLEKRYGFKYERMGDSKMYFKGLILDKEPF